MCAVYSPGFSGRGGFPVAALCWAVGFCHPGNQSCCQSALLPSLLNPPESLRHVCLAEILSGWSWDGNNTPQPCDKPMLPVDMQRHGSSRKCLNLLGSISSFLRPARPLLAFPRSSSKSSLWGRTKQAASSKTGTTPAPWKGRRFPFASGTDRPAAA